MNEVGVLAATGFLGSGFLPESLDAAMRGGIDVLGCDAGSTDAGPYYLGSGSPIVGRTQYTRDLELLLKAHVTYGVPLVIGSAGGSGSDQHVNWTREILDEIATRNKLALDVAYIYTEVDSAYVRDKLVAGRTRPLQPEMRLDPNALENVAPIVSQIGAEPIIEAVRHGAGVVIAGRACDAAIYAAIPIMKGAPAHLAWHAGKVVECGAASAVHRITADCMATRIQDDEFVLEAPNPDLFCTPVSVAAQSIYESSNPYRFVLPSGVLDLTNAHYRQQGRRAVAAGGGDFQPADVYTLKLEGVVLDGYRSSCVAGIQDPFILDRLDDFLEEVEHAVRRKVDRQYRGTLDQAGYQIVVHRFGNPTRASNDTDAEVAVLLDVVAQTQEIATEILGVLRMTMLHHPVAEWTGHVANLSLPHGLSSAAMGPAYRFALNHVVEVDDPLETVRIHYVSVGSAGGLSA